MWNIPGGGGFGDCFLKLLGEYLEAAAELEAGFVRGHDVDRTQGVSERVMLSVKLGSR